MKKITVILLSIFISLYTLAQTPAGGGNGNAPEMEASGDTTQLAGDYVLESNPVVISRHSVNAFKASKDFTYLKNLDSLLREEQKEKIKDAATPSQSDNWLVKVLGSVITRDIFWLLAVCFVGFILYKLFLSEGIFQKRSAYVKADKMEAEDEVPHKVSDYNLLIEKAIAIKDFRLAVRYLYLLALRQLSDDKRIQLAPDKTNYQYQLELKDEPLKKWFGLITFQYECVWYGGFEINDSVFTSIRNDFKNFTAQLYN